MNYIDLTIMGMYWEKRKKQNLPLHVYLYGSRNLYEQWRENLNILPKEHLQLHRLKTRRIDNMKANNLCFIDIDHIQENEYFKISETCKRKNILQMDLTYGDSTPRKPLVQKLRHQALKVLSGEENDDETFVWIEDIDGPPNTGTNKRK